MEFNVTASATMTIRLSADVKSKLEHLARDTRRSRSYLAAEAVSAYVERELEIVGGVQRGLADFALGRVVSQEQAESEIQDVLEASKG